jgi:hypothetical protein
VSETRGIPALTDGLPRVVTVALSLIDPTNEIRPFFYAIRAVAFVLILMAIVDKNRTPT